MSTKKTYSKFHAELNTEFTLIAIIPLNLIRNIVEPSKAKPETN